MKKVRRSILVGVLAAVMGVLVACTPSGGGSNAPAAPGSAAPAPGSAEPAPSTAGGYGY
jgi:hypothetical protein